MWFSSWLRNPNRQGLQCPRPAFRPTLEALEDRTLPSSYAAATTSALIADINAANQAGGTNTITLTAPTTSPYVLTAVNNITTKGSNPVAPTDCRSSAARRATT